MASPCCRLVTKRMFHSRGVLSPYNPQMFGLEHWVMGPVRHIGEDGTITETEELGAWADYQTCEAHGGYIGPGGGLWFGRRPDKKYHSCGMEIKENK